MNALVLTGQDGVGLQRATPPGKCHSCSIRETPEWRRGPDGARTLCNACGLRECRSLDSFVCVCVHALTDVGESRLCQVGAEAEQARDGRRWRADHTC